MLFSGIYDRTRVHTYIIGSYRRGWGWGLQTSILLPRSWQLVCVCECIYLEHLGIGKNVSLGSEWVTIFFRNVCEQSLFKKWTGVSIIIFTSTWSSSKPTHWQVQVWERKNLHRTELAVFVLISRCQAPVWLGNLIMLIISKMNFTFRKGST